MTLIMLLVLAAYYMLKTAREVFILGEGGAEVVTRTEAARAQRADQLDRDRRSRWEGGKGARATRLAGARVRRVDVLGELLGQGPGRFGQAEILWDVIPFDWINDSNTAAKRALLMSQIKPGSVVLFHDTYSSTVDLVYQFIPVLKANGYHLVKVSQRLGPREPGSTYGARDNGPPANDLHEIAVDEIPTLPNTPSPPPMPNFPITDIPGANSGGPNNGA